MNNTWGFSRRLSEAQAAWVTYCKAQSDAEVPPMPTLFEAGFGMGSSAAQRSYALDFLAGVEADLRESDR